MKDIVCTCGTLFGKENGTTLTIKHRDLYRSVLGGKVSGPCRGCGQTVEWQAQDNDDDKRPR